MTKIRKITSINDMNNYKYTATLVPSSSTGAVSTQTVVLNGSTRVYPSTSSATITVTNPSGITSGQWVTMYSTGTTSTPTYWTGPIEIIDFEDLPVVDLVKQSEQAHENRPGIKSKYSF